MDRIESVEDHNAPNGNPERTQPTRQPTDPGPSRPTPPLRSRRPSIRLSRFPSIPSLDNVNQPVVRHEGPPLPSFERQPIRSPPPNEEDEAWLAGRRRSSSDPGRLSSPPPDVLSRVATPMRMGALTEEPSHESPASVSSAAILPPQETEPNYEQSGPQQNEVSPALARPPGRLRRTSQAALNRFSRNRASTVTGAAPTLSPQDDQRQDEYGTHVVDVLDVIDPEVSALSTLTNVQNSLFVPNLGGFINRMPTYTITRPQYSSSDEEQDTTTDDGEPPEKDQVKDRPTLEQVRRFTSMSDVLRGPKYAVLPEGHALEGWSKEDFAELNDHVRHMLHSRRSKFKRAMKGFRQYVRKPLGFLVTLYATLITLFGLAWVLFLIGWINVGGKQSYVVNIIDNILVALFAIMGDGLAPFRAVDTYHMSFIAHYTFLSWKLRRKRDLPGLKDKNDLPSMPEKDVDLEIGTEAEKAEHEFSVLDARQQLRLMHHQTKFAKSHTFYKPHETMTHHAFPLRLLIVIVVLLDCHSLLQMALGACTWSMEDPDRRPFALTTVILCCSLTCNITGGVLIMVGDRRTRKKDVVERIFRQELTQEAMKKMEKKKIKEERRSIQIERRSAQIERSSAQIERPSSQIDRSELQNST
ncbi:hypothetical protein N7457_001624 [Penicillium paradoxum]|uniref:uncharacterized protein n=1 Tax=Penicillium paradoxum TaxID=176176 RepID=UPI00254728D4|nr:uncharacterized protein N7457_001624 [Penicillium paradoxum]KAJ5795025.1 hypothetical protein N7457_001624 [Penicillium paradoxum]